MQNGYYWVKSKPGCGPEDPDVVMVDTGFVFLFLEEHPYRVEEFLKTHTVLEKIKAPVQKTSITGGGHGLS